MKDCGFENTSLVVLEQILDEMRALGDSSLRAPKCENCEVTMDACDTPVGEDGCRWHSCPICHRYVHRGESDWVRSDKTFI